MEPFKKVVRLGTQKEYDSRNELVNASIYCKIEYRAKAEVGKYELSISGVIGPTSNGNALGGCGQICISSMAEIAKITPAPNWTHKTIKQFMDIWDEWHLNDMNAATPEMKAAGWVELTRKEIYKYSFSMTNDNCKRREKLERRCIDGAVDDNTAPILSSEEKRLLQSTTFKDVYGYTEPTAPEFMELSKDFRSNFKSPKIEKTTLGWVRPSEHPDGLLGKELNGKTYGGAWYYEAVPDKVLQWLKDLPDTDIKPAWI